MTGTERTQITYVA